MAAAVEIFVFRVRVTLLADRFDPLLDLARLKSGGRGIGDEVRARKDVGSARSSPSLPTARRAKTTSSDRQSFQPVRRARAFSVDPSRVGGERLEARLVVRPER
jgi:hypothetical protein